MKCSNKWLMYAFGILGVVIIIYLIVKNNSESYRRRRGPWIDEACQDYDCDTEEGRNQATMACQADFGKSPMYANFATACSDPDLEVRQYACPESCDPKDRSAFVQFKGKAILPQCSDDPKYPDKSVDGVTYCWGNNQTYIVRSKAKTA